MPSFRRQTIVIVSLTFVLFVIVLSLLSAFVLFSGFEDLEKDQIARDARMVANTMVTEQNDLEMTTLDWAAWNDTYESVERGDATFFDENLPEPGFANLRLNLCVAIDPGGRIVYGSLFDPATQQRRPLLPADEAYLIAHPSLWNFTRLDDRVQGIILLGGTTTMISSCPITTSQANGPVHGALIMGRRIDQAEMERIGATLQVTTALAPSGQLLPGEVPSFSSFRIGSEAIAIDNRDADVIAGYFTVQDLFGEPAVTVQIIREKSLLREGVRMLTIFFVLMLAFLVMIGAMNIWFISRTFTKMESTDQELQQQADNLRQRNDDLVRFAYVASHDLQEPIRTVVSFSQLLERRYKGKFDAEADDYLRFIANAGQRMHQLVNSLLEYSRTTTREIAFDAVDTEVVLSGVLENMAHTILEFGATVTHEQLPVVRGDAQQISQVFQNLIENAVKFRSADPPRIHVSAESAGDMWRFSVRDNGIGIEPQYLDKIFVIFQRLHGQEQYPGTGIGLAIVKRIVERHGGDIWVESEPGRGSTFFFTLSAPRPRL